jgi:hypothetical protein
LHATCRLYLVRETRHGEKAKDLHNALSRYHAKMRQREG